MRESDHDFLDSYLLDPADKAALFAAPLRELPPGLNTPELLALEPGGGHNQKKDLDFLTSPQAREIIQEEGIILVDYRPLQALWRGDH